MCWASVCTVVGVSPGGLSWHPSPTWCPARGQGWLPAWMPGQCTLAVLAEVAEGLRGTQAPGVWMQKPVGLSVAEAAGCPW